MSIDVTPCVSAAWSCAGGTARRRRARHVLTREQGGIAATPLSVRHSSMIDAHAPLPPIAWSARARARACARARARGVRAICPSRIAGGRAREGRRCEEGGGGEEGGEARARRDWRRAPRLAARMTRRAGDRVFLDALRLHFSRHASRRRATSPHGPQRFAVVPGPSFARRAGAHTRVPTGKSP